MKNSNLKRKLYILVSSIVFFLLIPIKCFSQAYSVTTEEARILRKSFITEVKKYVGSPYVLGAIGPDKFDCSGLVYYCSQKAVQKQLPRTVKALYSYVKLVPDSKKEIGDLMFFKTRGDGSISHVGVYIGNNQFISALSDGPNTGVVVSSIKEAYWKPKYFAVGRFLPSAKESSENAFENEESNKNSEENAENSFVSGGNSSVKFVDKLFLDGTLTCDWSLFNEKQFIPNFRGLTLGANIFYAGKTVSPGFGFQTKWNYGTKTFQIPLIFLISLGKYFNFYAGPVFSFGKSYQPSTDDEIKASIFPGIIGFQVQTPALGKGKFKFKIFQDVSYTVYNNLDGAALSFIKSASSGLVLNTGVRVTFPMNVFFKK